MESTPKMGIPYPVRKTREWYQTYTDTLNAIDQALYAACEDRNTIITGGGNFTFNGSGLLTWASAIEIYSPITGFNWTIPAGNITIPDTQVVYVTLTRSPTQAVTLTPALAANLSLQSRDASFVLGIRRGSIFYARNGRTIASGDSFALFSQSSTGGSGASGQSIRENATITTFSPVDESTYSVIGAIQLNPANYVLDGTTVSYTLKITAAVTDSGLTGDVRLHNLTDASTVSTLSWTGAGDTTPTEKTAVISLASGNKVYEIQARVTGGTPPADQVLVYSSIIQIDRTIT